MTCRTRYMKIRSVLDCRARSKNTAKNKLIGCFFDRRKYPVSGICRVFFLSLLFCRRMPHKAQLLEWITKANTGIKCAQMHGKCVYEQAFFGTRLRKNGACVLRVRRPLISDLYCRKMNRKFKLRKLALLSNKNWMCVHLKKIHLSRKHAIKGFLFTCFFCFLFLRADEI